MLYISPASVYMYVYITICASIHIHVYTYVVIARYMYYTTDMELITTQCNILLLPLP